MKYLILPALTPLVIAVSLAGCASDQRPCHDIYRAEYKYKPLGIQHDSATPSSSHGLSPASTAPATNMSPASTAPAGTAPGSMPPH